MSTDKHEQEIDALNEQAWQLSSGKPTKAFEIAQQALLKSQIRTPPYKVGEARSKATLANAKFNLGDYKEAIDIGLETTELAKQIGDYTSLLRGLEALGQTHRELGDHSAALETQLERLKITQQMNDPFEHAHTLNRLGSVYSHLGRYEDALEQYQKALPIYQNLKDTLHEGFLYHNMCIEYTALGEYAQALIYGYKCLKNFQSLGRIYGAAKTHGILAELFYKQGKYNQALTHLKQALTTLEQEDNKYYRLPILVTMGRVYTQLNHPETFTVLNKALDLAQELDAREQQFACHKALAEAYKAQGDFQQALYHFEQFHTIKETIFNLESDTKLKNLEIRHRVQETQKELEQQKLLREQDRLYFESLAQMKDDVLSTVSHDLKNPLTSILSSLHLLKSYGYASDERSQKYLEFIEQSVNQMRRLIIDILDFARLATGRSLQTKLTSLPELLEQNVAESKPFAQTKNITISYHRPEDNIWLVVDDQQIYRVVENLLSNAIKYTPTGGQVIITTAVAQTDEVVVQIQDSGIGIAPKDIPFIFERFYRVQNSAYESEGTGLGLSIAKAIVEQHGGEIWVESNPSSGSTFSFSLPLTPNQPSLN